MNKNFQDNLRTAAGELKRLQERIKELQSKNSGLQGVTDVLSKQKDDALLRYIEYSPCIY